MNPIEKYNLRAKKINSLLCVGLDPDIEKVKGSQFEFCKKIIEETHEFAAAYKMNSAFFEAKGDEGWRELKQTIDYIKNNYPDIFTILDAKRGDIGNTNNGYTTSIFDWLGFDAVTLHPYLGEEALAPFLERKDKVSIILCRTSNPGAAEFQDLIIMRTFFKIIPTNVVRGTLWGVVADMVIKKWNKNNNCMLVVGATYPKEMKMIRKIAGDMTFLVPGIGAQGGDLEAVMKVGLNSEGLGLIINSSRGIIFASDPKAEAQKLCEEIRKYLK